MREPKIFQLINASFSSSTNGYSFLPQFDKRMSDGSNKTMTIDSTKTTVNKPFNFLEYIAQKDAFLNTVKKEANALQEAKIVSPIRSTATCIMRELLLIFF